MIRQREDTVWDPGVQNERTALAWVRTVLSVLGALIAAAKLALASAPLIVIPLAIGGGLIALSVLSGVAHRYRQAHQRLHAGQALPGAALSAGTAALAVSVGLATLVWIVSA